MSNVVIQSLAPLRPSATYVSTVIGLKRMTSTYEICENNYRTVINLMILLTGEAATDGDVHD